MNAFTAQLPILPVLLPLLAAPLCILLRRGAWTANLALATAAAATILSALLLERALAEGALFYALGGFPPPFGIAYRIDAANAAILLLVSAAATLALLHTRPLLNEEIPPERQALFHTAFLLCLCGLLGVAATGDAFNAFVFLEISSLATYGLVAMGRSRRALTAAYRYLILGTIGASLFVIGVGFLYMATGTLNMSDLALRLPTTPHRALVEAGFALIVIGLGLKAAMFPLHFWLPNVYAHAPSSVVIFLAAAATKVALYLLARFLFIVFPDAAGLSTSLAASLLLPTALAAMFLASLAAVRQEDIRRLLAYSSIAQIGFMLLALSLGSREGIAAAWLLLLTHGLVKGGLFMSVAAMSLRLGGARLADWSGGARVMPYSSAIFVVGLAALVGVPLTAGFIGKWALLEALFSPSLIPTEPVRWFVAAMTVAASLLTFLYAGRILERLYLGSPPPTHPTGMHEAPPLMLILTGALALANLLFGFYATPLRALSNAAATALLGG